MSNIQKSLTTISGSFTKIEIADVIDIASIGDPNEFNEITNASIAFNAGKNWRTIEKASGGMFNVDGDDTPNGALFEFEASGKTMLAPRELVKITSLLKKRLVVKITDGDGLIWLCGNKTEYLKFKYKKVSGASRSEAKLIEFTLFGSLTKQISLLV